MFVSGRRSIPLRCFAQDRERSIDCLPLVHRSVVRHCANELFDLYCFMPLLQWLAMVNDNEACPSNCNTLVDKHPWRFCSFSPLLRYIRYSHSFRLSAIEESKQLSREKCFHFIVLLPCSRAQTLLVIHDRSDTNAFSFLLHCRSTGAALLLISMRGTSFRLR